MNINSLVKIKKRKKKRLGQGHGSGRGKTAGRGTKGQNARGKRPVFFEGGAVALTKRLPFLRGKGKNKSFSKNPLVVNVGALNILPKNTVVDIKTLSLYKIVDEAKAKSLGVKILGNGEVTIPLTVSFPISKKAAETITKAGGTCVTRSL